jgi:flagellar export protein FliJ
MAKKSSEIATLLRVQSWTVDEQRRMLGQMVAREEALLQDRAEMGRQLLREQQVAAGDPTLAGHAYAAYAENYRVRRTSLDGLIAALAVEIEQQRDRLADAYRELKVLEEVRNAWRKAERAEAARIEQNDMDEIAQNLFRRQQR